MDWMTLFAELWKRDRGKILGVAAGLLFALFVLSFGFWQALFIGVCVFIGLAIGKSVDNNGSFQAMMQKIREAFSRKNEEE